MPACSIKWCGKNSKTSSCKKDGITFHRYPKIPSLKEKWINATKRENWFPTEFSVICSRHFTQDCFYEMKNRRRLLSSAVPTLLLPQLGDKSSLLTIMPTVLVKVEAPPASNGKEATDKRLTEKTDETREKTSDELSVKKRLGRRIIELSNQIKQKNRQIKNFRQKTTYLTNRVTSLKAIIKEIKMSCRCKANVDNAE